MIVQSSVQLGHNIPVSSGNFRVLLTHSVMAGAHNSEDCIIWEDGLSLAWQRLDVWTDFKLSKIVKQNQRCFSSGVIMLCILPIVCIPSYAKGIYMDMEKLVQLDPNPILHA